VISQASSAYSQELAPWEKKGKIDNDPVLKERVNRITDRLVAQAIRYRPDAAKWNWQVAVIDDPKTLNAYCLPGGRMAIYTGLINKLHATDDEIGQVMGHEIGHALANHGAEKMSNAMAAQGAVALATALAGQHNQAVVGNLGPMMTQLGWLLPNSRTAESEADRIGIELAARAGYDPAASISLWNKMKAAGGNGTPQFLSTHPAPDTRIRDLNALVPHMQPLYAEAAKNPAALPTRLAANVRDVTPGSASASHVVPSTLRPLTLVNPAYERFRSGEAALECGSCAISLSNRADKLKTLDARGDWEGLAREVLDIGFSQDIAWYYLGRAAEGQGLRQAALRYYQQAANLARHKETHCKGLFTDVCNGVHLPEQAEAAQARLVK
jgi:predicted Zn-dependent protease